jgi:hypothetical protein
MRPRRAFEPATTSFTQLAATNVSSVSGRITQIIHDILPECNPYCGILSGARDGALGAPRLCRNPACWRPIRKTDDTVPCTSVSYEILIPRGSIRNRKLTRLGGKERADKEAIMLDVAFVALGIAVLALMGVYALALRQL